MTYDEAKALLSTCLKEEINHPLGGRYIYWSLFNNEIAYGSFTDFESVVRFVGTTVAFHGDLAGKLRGYGTPI